MRQVMFKRATKMSIARIFAKLLFAALLAGALTVCPASSLNGDQGNFLKLHFCQFDADNKIYNQTDALRCLDELTTKIINLQASSRSISEKMSIYSSDFENYPIKNDKELTQSYGYQLYDPQLPSFSRPPAHYPTTEAGYLTPQQVLPVGSSLNLFNALTSISRYDDYRCIPRILCEVAAGVIPSSDSYTRSTTSSLITFGKNTIINLLNSFDTTGTFPLLNFAKAAILGYSNRGNSNTCYRAYSKCPRNPSDLVDYLNNHNGGFFRLFNGVRGIYKNFIEPLSYEEKSKSTVNLNEQYDSFPQNINNAKKVMFYDQPNKIHVRSNKFSFFPKKINEEQTFESFVFPTANRQKDILKRSSSENKVKFPED